MASLAATKGTCRKPMQAIQSVCASPHLQRKPDALPLCCLCRRDVSLERITHIAGTTSAATMAISGGLRKSVLCMEWVALCTSTVRDS